MNVGATVDVKPLRELAVSGAGPRLNDVPTPGDRARRRGPSRPADAHQRDRRAGVVFPPTTWFAAAIGAFPLGSPPTELSDNRGPRTTVDDIMTALGGSRS